MRIRGLAGPQMGYWTATEEVLATIGEFPRCPKCGRAMLPVDDHGRFVCFACPVNGTIHEVKLKGRTKIEPLTRLSFPPTAAELRLSKIPPVNGEYEKALEEVAKERQLV